MTSVEKRRSRRKSGGHRKPSDGGYSDTSSGGSFLDETDREVSNLTDRAFRSLCIGDDAVYNDSDLCSSSPCSQRDRQLAFSHSGGDRDGEDREREELKRAAHESFSLRVQQYGQDWIHEGMYGAEIHRDPQWDVYGERTQGRVSATFQHSFVETSQQGESLREGQLSFLSNGAAELSSQQRRSRSRVSSLIRAFNSEGHGDGAGMDSEWNDEPSWDKSALMSIQRELSEFSSSYQQNFNSGHFPSAGSFSSRDTNFYSSEVAAVAHMNSASSFMRSSHSKHSMSAQVNCNSNFFIHSEYSPFKVWRDHNRFPFQQGEVSGFMHCSEFPKWYETPMYKELSLGAQPHGPSRFEERGFRQQRNNFAPVVPPTSSRSTSTSTMLQKALAVEKRCESELAGHYPHRKRTQSLGTNRLPSQRPSTASPTTEMSRRVQDTISSVKALQQKLKMMTEQNITTAMTANQQGVHCSNHNLIPYSNNANTVAADVVSNNTSTTPFNISHLLTPLVHANRQAETSEVRQCAVSPQPVEHPPVRAESRGATPDVRMSSYKSRATSLLFNLKDNRKRVKSTYSPTKFKGLETQEKNKQLSTLEPRDTVIDIPDFPDPDTRFSQVEESSRTNAASHPYVNQYHNPGFIQATLNSQPATAHTGQYSEYDYQPAQMQGATVHHPGFTGFIPENYATNQLANGQNLHEGFSSFTPYKQGMTDNVETLGGDIDGLKASYTATETPRLNAYNNQTREYLISNTEQHFNETVGREFTKVDRYQQLKDNKHDYNNVSSQDRWRQTHSQDTENLSLKTALSISPWKQEITSVMEKDQHAQAFQRAAAIKEELNLPRDKHRGENQQSVNKEVEKIELRESFGVETSSYKKAELVNPNISNQLPQYAPFSNDTVENPVYYGQQQSGAFKDKHALQKYYWHNKEPEMADNYLTQNSNRYNEYRNQHPSYSNKDKTIPTQETGQTELIPKGREIQRLQPIEAEPHFEHNMKKNALSNPHATASTMANQIEQRQFDEAKAEQAIEDHIRAKHAQTELAKAQNWAEVEQPKVESARLNLAAQTSSEKVQAKQVKAELTEHGRVNQTKAEYIEDGKSKEEQAEQSREKQLEQSKQEHTKAEQTRVQKVTEEPKNITEEAGAEPMREAQGERVKAEQAGAERLKEELIKPELAKTEQAEQARVKKTKTEQVMGERITTRQLKEEKVKAEEDGREQMEAEKIRTEKVKAEQAKLERIKEQHAKLEKEKNRIVEDDSIQTGQVNAEKSANQTSKARDEKVECRKKEQAKFEQTKEEAAKAELTKTQNMQEMSAKLGAKLTGKHQVKNEPDKVEQVKTELAKAKAELAKIKEKMRGEQKEKGKNMFSSKQDEIKKDVSSGQNIKKNEKYKNQDQAKQIHQDRTDSVVVSRQSTDQVNIGLNEYERLREKYGFTDTPLTNRKKLSIANVSSNDVDGTSALPPEKIETTNNEKSKDKHSPKSRFATDNTEKREEVSSFKSNEVTESHYVYSESSKEFKLSSNDYLPTTADRGKSDPVNDNDSVKKLEKSDPLKHADVSQQRDSDLVKPLAIERKPKSMENSAGTGKDLHFTPSRALLHKDRAQTKQEILTSKIKAHAEKEISAIKEKGFAIRDGFVSKSSAKQLAGSQTVNIRQRPPSQEVFKKHESSMSSNSAPKHQMENSGTQMEAVKSSSPPSAATVTVKSPANSSQFVVPLQVQVTKEPMKTSDNVLKPSTEAIQTGSFSISTVESSVDTQKLENQSEIKSPVQSKEKALKDKQENQEENHEDNSGKQKERLEDNPAVNTDHLNQNKADLSQATALLKAKNFKPITTEKAESKHEAVNEDSAPSLNLVICQNKTLVADDNLQIMGIMVTVRERNPSMNNDQRNDSTREHINAKEKEWSNSEQDKCYHSSGLEVSEGNKSSKEVGSVKAKEAAVQNTQPTMQGDQTKVGTSNHGENVRDISTQETRQNNVSENVTVKMASSSTNARTQRPAQIQEPLAEVSVPSTVTAPVPAKNKVLAETQPKQDNKTRESEDFTDKMPKENVAKSIRKDEVKSNTEEKNQQIRQTTHTNENLMDKMVNTRINNTNDSSRVNDEMLRKYDTKPSMKEDMTTVINPFKSRSKDGNKAPLLEEQRQDSTPPKPFNTTNHLTENENIHVSPKHQYGENNQVEDNVHIGSIAIRVLPAVMEKDNQIMVEKHHVTTVPSDAVAANEHKQVASSSPDEKVNILKNEDKTKSPALARSEKQMKHSVGDEPGEQHMLSSVIKMSDSLKISNQENRINTTSENTQTENRKSEKVNESEKLVGEPKIQPIEGDYFQVHGLVETNNDTHSSANVRDTPDAVAKGRELPGLISNKAAMSNDSNNEGKIGVSASDHSKMKTVESSSVNVHSENVRRKNRETEDNLASKQSDGPKGRQSNKNEKTEEGQTICTRKQYTDNQSSLSARERQRSRNSHPTKENTLKETPEVKPKPKERVSTIPEISAIADYARLKVIVSEDRENTIQEFPPNKKEGFFPLIQTRHSRRPVFTADPQDLSVKEKNLPNKTEVSSKVNKEPKPLVFPITDKEHQRTGMFKLGDKERQEKMLLDAKSNEHTLDTGAKHAQHLKERNKSPKTHPRNQGSKEQVVAPDPQRVPEVDQSIHQPNNPPLQTTTSAFAVNRPRHTSVSQHQKQIDNSHPLEKLKDFSSKTETTPFLDKNFHPQPLKDSIQQQTTVSKNETIENELAKNGQERPEKLREQRPSSSHEETTTKQNGAKHLEKEQAKDLKTDMKIKHMLEESRASLAEEARRVAQREEERRAREREAIANKIKERREKQREEERGAEKERKAKQTEEERASLKEEEMRTKQREEEMRMRETEDKRRIKVEEEEGAKLREEERQIKEKEERRMRRQEEERAAQEERQRRAAQKEQQKRAAQEEQQRRAAQEEQQRRAAQEEKQRRAVQEEKQRRAAQDEQQTRAAQEEQQRRAAQDEEQKKAAQDEEQRRAAQEEKQRRAAQEEKQRRAAQEEEQKRAAQEEEQEKAAQEEEQEKAAQEEQQRRAVLMEEHRRANEIEEKILNDIEEEKKRKQREETVAQISEEERIKQRGERQKKEQWMRIQREEEERRTVLKQKTLIKQREDQQVIEERAKLLEESQAALKEEEKRVAPEQMLTQGEGEIKAKEKEEEQTLAAYRGKVRDVQSEDQNKAAQRMDALQYYAISSSESEMKPRGRQLCSPLPVQQRNNPSGLGSTEDSHSKPHRPHAPASPAPSLPRSNTSSPALGLKPSMFRVKDNTNRGSSLTKSVKPRFHKNFGEDFRVGSPIGSDRVEDEQYAMRRSAVTPLLPDMGVHRLAAIKESSTLQPASSSQDYSVSLPHHRPYSRRSIALDEDDSRSVISNMSEDVESFATSAADLADVRALYDYERPESACSYSSDVSRSLGKPPAVPPKSEKALRRAKRLTSRRIKKELSKPVADSSAGVENPLQDASSIPSSSSTEVCSSNRPAVAYPHFTPPVSLAHAPVMGSGFPSSQTERQSSHSSVYSSPHATGPVSLPAASPHTTAPVSLPVASPHATGHVSNPAAPKTVTDVPSSPTVHHPNHPAPVTQYHVESSYPQSYPLTQRKVLQDLGSGQYFVVDVPVEVKKKTFFDPETGKYVQLNVRESAKSTSLPQPQQSYLQPQLKPQINVKPQQQPLSQDSPAGKPIVLYQGYHGYPQGYQPASINSMPQNKSSAPVTPHQDQQPVRESYSYGYPAPEMRQNSEGHRYSPEKTPYMDTVNNTDKTYGTVYNTQGPYESFPECDTNSQLAGSSVCENENSAHSRCHQPCNIITMSELDDFMELSDW